MAEKTTKCAWCGAVVPLTKDGQRPKQHRNGTTTCCGSGQPVEHHTRIQTANPNRLDPKPRKVLK